MRIFITAITLIVALTASAQDVKTVVKFYSQGIVRVVKYNSLLNKQPEHKSYPVVMTPEKLTLKTETAGDVTSMSSELLTVKLNNKSGRVEFFTADGKQLLAEGATSACKEITEGVDKGKYSIAQSWKLDGDEALFGLGQRHEFQTMNQRGQKIEMWNQNTHTYIPYFTSNKGYGVYWDNSGRTFFDDTQKETTMSSTVSTCIDYYFLYNDGTQDGLVAQIHKLTGKPTMFPLWTYGFWQCRERYRTPDELSSVLDEYRKRNVPLDGIVQDWQYWGCDSNWNSMKFENPHYLNKIGDEVQMRFLPNDENPQTEIEKFKKLGAPRLKTPQDMIDYVHANNAHLMISIWPDFGPWTEQYAELKKINALYPFDTWPRNRGVLVFDAFNPQARDIYWKYLTNLYNMGIDAWWSDSTEPDHFEKPGDNSYLTYDGSWESVKNAFPFVTNKGIYEHLRKAKGNTKRAFQMTRSASFGLQHYGSLSWSGDITSNWNEFKNQIPSGLNYVICGIPMWNTDLGGFFCWDYRNDPKDVWGQELNVRWMQWGTFLPLMRSHCSSPMVKEIYQFGNEGDWAYDAMKSAIELRYRFLPYIYSMAGGSVQRSELMMRPFVMDFPNDKTAINRDDAYMFGRSILVRPVTDPLYTWQDNGKHGHLIYPDITKASAPVDVYLPTADKQKTVWYDLYTHQRYEGGRSYKVLAPIDRMPVFVRGGSIIPLGPVVQHTNEILKDGKWNTLDVVVYPGEDAEFTLYEDAGDGYEYEKGEFSTISMTWDNEKCKLTIADRKGKFKGMAGKRTFNVQLAGSHTPKTIEYSGNAVEVDL